MKMQLIQYLSGVVGRGLELDTMDIIQTGSSANYSYCHGDSGNSVHRNGLLQALPRINANTNKAKSSPVISSRNEHLGSLQVTFALTLMGRILSQWLALTMMMLKERQDPCVSCSSAYPN